MRLIQHMLGFMCKPGHCLSFVYSHLGPELSFVLCMPVAGNLKKTIYRLFHWLKNPCSFTNVRVCCFTHLSEGSLRLFTCEKDSEKFWIHTNSLWGMKKLSIVERDLLESSLLSYIVTCYMYEDKERSNISVFSEQDKISTTLIDININWHAFCCLSENSINQQVDVSYFLHGRGLIFCTMWEYQAPTM